MAGYGREYLFFAVNEEELSSGSLRSEVKGPESDISPICRLKIRPLAVFAKFSVLM